MKRSFILSCLYIVPLLIAPCAAHADLFFAVRTYCMPEEGRFQLEPFPIGYPAAKMPLKDIAIRKKQSVIPAPKAQDDGQLKASCQIYGTAYKAVIE